MGTSLDTWEIGISLRLDSKQERDEVDLGYEGDFLLVVIVPEREEARESVENVKDGGDGKEKGSSREEGKKVRNEVQQERSFLLLLKRR